MFTDVNPCDTGNGGCNHYCNYLGDDKFECTCRGGYTLYNEYTCEGIYEFVNLFKAAVNGIG